MKKNNCNGFSFDQKKPDIEYPCLWQYKVIGKNRDELDEAIKQICPNIPVTVKLSNTSSSGKYCSLNVELKVTDEAMRNSIFAAFQDHAAVTMVI